jgi:hypothetical protein
VKTTWIAIAALASLVAGTAGLAARQASERVDNAVNAKIRDEGLNRSQVETTFGMLVDQIGPRLTASPAHKRAAERARHARSTASRTRDSKPSSSGVAGCSTDRRSR